MLKITSLFPFYALQSKHKSRSKPELRSPSNHHKFPDTPRALLNFFGVPRQRK